MNIKILLKAIGIVALSLGSLVGLGYVLVSLPYPAGFCFLGFLIISLMVYWVYLMLEEGC